MSLPTKFKDLGIKELRRTAVEDFAVPVEKDDNSDAVIAALAEAGVDWAQYVEMHPEVKPEEPAVIVEETTVRTETPVAAVAPQVAPEPVTAAPVVASGNQPWLIKMTRENIRYDTRGYSFTQEHPYALVQPEDVEYLLEVEDGFRQAYPSELSDYYAR